MNLKKIIFFLCFSFLFISPCKAITPTVEYQEGFYSNRIGPDKTYSGQMGFLVVDGKVVFCLEPYKIIGNDYEIDNSYFNNYSEEDLEYIKLVSNYVDSFIQKRDIYYYMAGQELIWERLYGKDTVSFTTKKNSAGNIINLENYKNEIETYVNSFFIKPSFDGTSIRDNFDTIVELEDVNGVLDQYDIVSNGLNTVWKENNKLYIKILSSKLSEIKLVRKEGNGDSVYYHSSTNQDLAALNSSVENISYINVKSNNEYSENISINFLDKMCESLITDTILFEIVDLDNNKVIASTQTYNGIYYTNLIAGNYELRVTGVPKKYLVTDSIKFSIDEENRLNNRSILIYLDRVTSGRLNVNSYKNDGLYQLYLKNKYVEQLISTFDETKSFDLSLGDYYVIDISTGKKYDIKLEYKDAYTPIIIYNLDIYPEETELKQDNKETEENDEQDITNSDEIKENNNDEIVEDNESSNDKEEMDVVNQNDKTEKENYQGFEDKKQIIDVKEKDNKILDNDLENVNKKEENNNLNDNIDKEDEIVKDININNIKEIVVSDIKNLDKQENLTSKLEPKQDVDSVENIENIKTLPNTFNYMKTIKCYLFLILLLGLVIKFKKNEKE